MADTETFRQSGPWIESSHGFKVRSMGRAGMEYVRGSTRFELNAEALATNGFALYRSEIPEDERAQVLGDVTRAWLRAGFDVQPLGY